MICCSVLVVIFLQVMQLRKMVLTSLLALMMWYVEPIIERRRVGPERRRER